MDNLTLAQVRIQGVVQGVGFRPFVHRLASQHGLAGWVRNTSGSVEIEAEGDEMIVRSFLSCIRCEAPPRARIDSFEASFALPTGHSGFDILPSRHEAGVSQLISPDIAICEDCRREVLDQADRRYRYPFINCTNCGPRFTIIEDVPYDRPRTSMRPFRMCKECQCEYDDPQDRRFHAQPNACAQCGPRLWIEDGQGRARDDDDVISAAVELLLGGRILAIKGLGGFHLVCDATKEEPVSLLRERKRRPSKPFAVMLKDIHSAREHCVLTPAEESLLSAPESPIVLLKWRQDASFISPIVAPNQRFLGVMLPYTPLHCLLIEEADRPLVMTSGNLSGEPLAKENAEAVKKLGSIADDFLLHDREILRRCDDSVSAIVEQSPQIIRRARGYAPDPIPLSFKTSPVLGCGAELKNTFCLTNKDRAFLSPYIGDMECEETLRHFAEMITEYRRLFCLDPEIVAYDMHPDYATTTFAIELASKEGLRSMAVQHHHAHVASCLADNQVQGPVIGVAFDGTGYGPDGTIWGGEFLIADCTSFERVGHFEPVPMPGGEAAIKRPYRMALGYLYRLLGQDIDLQGLPLDMVDLVEREVIGQQVERGLNAPLTSSAGRLFDAVAALIGVRSVVDYEGQAAIDLEMAAADNASDVGLYPFSVEARNGRLIIGLSELLAAIVHDVRIGVAVSTISGRFHSTVAQAICAVCKRVAEDSGVKRVALTGGVFQNRLLLRLVTAALRRESFDVLIHRNVPCNDGGISLGQAVIASCINDRSGE